MATVHLSEEWTDVTAAASLVAGDYAGQALNGDVEYETTSNAAPADNVVGFLLIQNRDPLVYTQEAGKKLWARARLSSSAILKIEGV